MQKHFAIPERLDALADTALNGSSATRIMAIKWLDELSSRPDCADGVRKALLACAGDTSKQVQGLLVQQYIAHADWDSDYLAMLNNKKAAQRSLAVRVLAGIDVEKYRSVLENALTAEKNGKVMD